MSKIGFRVVELVSITAMLFVVLAIVGCASGGRVFSKEYLVGGGLEIDWAAKEKGTAYLVEETTNKVLKTQSLEEGGKFAFSIVGIEGEEQFEALFGVKLADAEFSLYFIPAEQEGSTK